MHKSTQYLYLREVAEVCKITAKPNHSRRKGTKLLISAAVNICVGYSYYVT